MLYCFDSSAVVKRYATERGSAWVRSIVPSDAENTIYLGQVGIVEIAAALSRKVRTQELSHDEYEAALWLFLMDVRNDEYVVTPLSDYIVELAVNLTRRHPLRGYDTVHLATAIALNNRHYRKQFLAIESTSVKATKALFPIMSNALMSAGLSQLVFAAADA